MKNLPASVHRRLLNLARVRNRPFNELLQHFALERFLYRLGQSHLADRFVLKGGLMLTVWHGATARPTRDVDFLAQNYPDEAEVAEMVRRICAAPVAEDGLLFDASELTVESVREEEIYDGMRVSFLARLGNAVVPMQLDIGLGDVVVPGPEMVDYPTLLDFPAPRIQGYSRESAIAEKLHAMIDHGPINSRMKDFYDIWFLAETSRFEADVLREAIRATFQRRGREIPAMLFVDRANLPPADTAQTQWRAFVTRSRIQNAPATFDEILAELERFLSPVLDETPMHGTWQSSGPWQEAHR